MSSEVLLQSQKGPGRSVQGSVLPAQCLTGSKLLCCVALCLLGAGHMDSGVAQIPKHMVTMMGYVVTAKGQSMTLRCCYEKGHQTVYWYKKALGQGPQFLVSYYDGAEQEKGAIPEGFKVTQFRNFTSELTVSSVNQMDAAWYLCASSLAQPCRSRSPEHKNLLPTPKYVVTVRRKSVTLRCCYENRHQTVYWYKQAPGQGPEFLVEYYGQNEKDKGAIHDQFKVASFTNYSSEMTLSSDGAA
ncbi:PREDICTED: uncharacterized protein LOC101632932 [Condylura cristata]|uniref:uncharacterized protein LOC101632932 n=1 Tax=Condylura cristata TaxID=143302 RepID=UPI000643AFB9|nr:PREDICTED: uncharacterized protein LOC101632932 [Condylura cristata]